MAQKQDTSVRVGFGDGELFRKDLVLETPYQVKYLISGYYVLYLYPAVNADLRTSNGGTVRYAPTGSTKTRTISNEYIEFSGSKRAKTRYPAGSASSGSLTFGVFDSGGTVLSGSGGAGFKVTKIWDEFYDKEGKTVVPTFTYDFDTGEVVSSVECYGAIKVDYQTSYRVIHYTPSSSFDYKTGFTMEMDTIVAFYKGSMASLKMGVEFVQGTEATNLEEVIKVYSEIVVDEEGAWEVPDDFPDATTTKYNNHSGYPGPSRAAYLTNQRIVHTVYADVQRGRLYERRFPESLEQPFAPALKKGHWFKPTYEVSTSTPSEASSDLQLDIQKRAGELKTEYGVS